MKQFYLIVCFLLFIQCCFSQDEESIIQILDGQWEWYKTYRGGFAGGYIYPEDSGFTITIEFQALQNDSLNFGLYKDEVLILDTITTISPIDTTVSLWAIHKNIIPVLKKYFIIFKPVKDLDYLCLWLDDKNHIAFSEPSLADSPFHLFERKTSNLLQTYVNECIINVHPIPFYDQLTIVGLPNENLLIEIYDIFGRLNYARNFHSNPTHIINTSYLNSGLYIVRIRNSDTGKVVTNRIIVKR